MPFRIPDVHAAGRWHGADALDGMARQWHAALLDAFGERPRFVGAALPASPEGVALFAALTALPFPPVLLGPDPVWWPTSALPAGTAVVLTPSFAHLVPHVVAQGSVPFILPEPSARTSAPPLNLLSGPGVVTFTSGSTGAPKPVTRARDAMITAVAARSTALGLQRGDGIIVGVTLAHGQGLNMLLSAMVIGGPLGFLPPVNHRAALATVALPQFACWRVTPHYADLLSRCSVAAPPSAPRVCLISSPVSVPVYDAFLRRFGVPLRQGYASGETGPIAVDNRPADDVRPGSVGTPLPSVQVSIGERPGSSAPSDEAGRLWIRSPYRMAGYGFPPEVEMPGEVDGWWPTRDLGRFRDDGQLVLAGRIDDCIRTRDGRLVNLSAVADIIRSLHHVKAVAVLPLRRSAGAAFGAVVACEPATSVSTLRVALSDVLPPWARPRTLAVVETVPMLPNGKPDRRACLAALGEETS